MPAQAKQTSAGSLLFQVKFSYCRKPGKTTKFILLQMLLYIYIYTLSWMCCFFPFKD